MDDLIRRQAAIDAECQACCVIPRKERGHKCGYYLDGCMEVKCLRDLPSAQQWIPVSSGKLPKEDETVLVTDHGAWVDLAFYDGLRWWYRDGSEETDGVTAWCPLPKPWEGGDSDA